VFLHKDNQSSAMELFVASLLISIVHAKRRKHIVGTIRETTIVAATPQLENRARKVVMELDYVVPPYCVFEYHGQLQTLLQFGVRHLLRVVKSRLCLPGAIRYQRELLRMPDGGTVGLDWAEKCWLSTQKSMTKDVPVVILHHGLVGDSQSEYIYHLAGYLLDGGFRVVVMVARGCGGLKLTSPELFAGRRVSDCAHCVQHVKERYRDAKLFWIGFSLGAALTLQYLADNHEDILKRAYTQEPAPTEAQLKDGAPASTPLTAAMSVCPPWDVSKNDGPVAPLWLSLLAGPMTQHYRSHQHYLNEHNFQRYGDITWWKLLFVRNMTQLDTLLFPSHHKASGGRYASLSEYYDDISPIHSAHRINTPTLALTARDDPVCDHRHTPTNKEQLGPGLVVVSSNTVLNCAFFEIIRMRLWQRYLQY
jgi:predicted alpha/beta-fold hydrolase